MFSFSVSSDYLLSNDEFLRLVEVVRATSKLVNNPKMRFLVLRSAKKLNRALKFQKDLPKGSVLRAKNVLEKLRILNRF